MRITVDRGRLEFALRELRQAGTEAQRDARQRAAGVTRSGRAKLKARRALRRLRKPRRPRPS